MSGLHALWAGSDAFGRSLMLLLLAMSVSAWVLILWKSWLLRRVQRDITRALPAYWAAPDAASGRQRLAALDRHRVLLPLLDAVDAVALGSAAGSLGATGPLQARLTRELRDALHQALAQLRYGQVVLASVGSTAPFVGLLGTVWGVYMALAGMGEGFSIERVASPIGEALVMTAAGIAVAVPAVLGYNAHGQRIAACEAELEGYAQDLLDLAAPPPAAPAAQA